MCESCPIERYIVHLTRQVLLIEEERRFEITHRGQDFLVYLVHRYHTGPQALWREALRRDTSFALARLEYESPRRQSVGICLCGCCPEANTSVVRRIEQAENRRL